MKFTKDNEETFSKIKETYGGEFYRVACNKCAECRINKSKEWTIRAYAEYLTNPNAYFITLTYENAPKNVNREHWKEFRRKLYDHIYQKDKRIIKNFKFLMCAEYGETTLRSHMHAIIYGIKLDDLTNIFTINWDKKPLKTSPTIQAIWNKGHVTVDEVTLETCRYVAGYVDKKLETETYKKLGLKKPFISASKGLGEEYFNKNYKKIYETDKIYIKDKIMQPPRYYDRLLFKKDIKLYKKVKEDRRKRGELLSATPLTDNQLNLYAKNKEYNLKIKLNSLKRNNI